jgi:hypothetical protein
MPPAANPRLKWRVRRVLRYAELEGSMSIAAWSQVVVTSQMESNIRGYLARHVEIGVKEERDPRPRAELIGRF